MPAKTSQVASWFPKMSTSWDADQERLPQMISSEDVAERQRLADLKQFRKYLVETGTVQCLVKMYKHSAKHEMRIDNPSLVTQFLAGYTDGNPDAEEIQTLQRENATLEEYNAVMESQVKDLQHQIARQKRRNLGRGIWRRLSPDSEADLSLDELFIRLCGNEVEPSTGEVLVDLLRPQTYKDIDLVTATRVSEEDFIAIVGDMESERHVSWLEELFARLQDSESGEAPYQRELMQAIIDSDLLPHDTFLLADAVELDENLVAFLEVVAAGRKDAPPPAILEEEGEHEEEPAD
ncbi:hypothetical protein AK812_SmicGene13430 [Symbiodinium microadriaticum]|uniref:Uncharacterized protein n=1 Tax=Symbiodinium microadriaticum TaxID=2951 RepID=A0A1Q9E849_SYMMI|nr:hypothetical protein AK812_SmicGene13430 [Symbiodinium microadriaticum]